MRFKVTLGKKPIHSELVSCVGWTTADELFSCADDHKVLKTNLITDETKEVSNLPSDVFPSDFHWAPKSAKKPGALDTFLLTATDGKFHLISANGRVEKSVDAHKGAVTSGRWSHDGLALVTAGEDGTVKTWSRSGMIRSTLAQGSVPVYSVVWGPDNDQILFTSGKSLTIKSLQAHLKPMTWKAHDGIVLKVDWNVTNNLLVSASEDCKYKVWDCYGRLLYTSSPHDYPVTSCAWAPDGESFAIGSYNTIRLCDKKGWSYSLDKAELGSVFSLTWSTDGTQVAGACGNGHVLLCHVVGRKLEWANYEMTVTGQKTIEIYDVSSDAVESLDVRDRIIKVAFGHSHLVVASTAQCYVYPIKSWNTPLIFDLKEASVHMIVLASRQFVLVDGSSIYVYSYDGRLLHQPKYTTLKTDTLNSNSLSLSNDTIAIKDKSEEEGMTMSAGKNLHNPHDKMEKKSNVRLFDTASGKPLGDGKPFQHKNEILQIALDQEGSPNERRLAFIDKNYDLFILSVRQIGKANPVEKLGSMCSGIVWNASSNMLAAQQDGKFSVWLYPNAVYVDRDLLKLVCVEKNLSEFGKNPQLLSFRDSFVTLRRADGALVSTFISPYPVLLHDILAKEPKKWEDAVRLCRLAKDESLWASLAALASYHKNLDTAEIAYASLGLADKVDYIRNSRDIPVKRAQEAELSLLAGNLVDGEGILLQAGLIFRAIMLNIELYRWDRAMELAIKHKTHVDTVVGYRTRYLKSIGGTEDKKLFAAFIAKGMNTDWDAIQAKITVEYNRERDPNAVSSKLRAAPRRPAPAATSGGRGAGLGAAVADDDTPPGRSFAPALAAPSGGGGGDEGEEEEELLPPSDDDEL